LRFGLYLKKSGFLIGDTKGPFLLYTIYIYLLLRERKSNIVVIEEGRNILVGRTWEQVVIEWYRNPRDLTLYAILLRKSKGL